MSRQSFKFYPNSSVLKVLFAIGLKITRTHSVISKFNDFLTIFLELKYFKNF